MDFPYNVGDKVLVRVDMYPGDRKVYSSYGESESLHIKCFDEHYKYCGRVVTIDYLDQIDGALKIKEDGHDIWWAAEMFLPVSTIIRNADENLIMNIVGG